MIDLSGKRILVFGDIMLDRYILCFDKDISQEAPSLKCKTETHVDCVGAAANVALNLAIMGAEVHLCGLVGKDDYADILINHLIKYDVKLFLLHSNSVQTMLKTRYLINDVQVFRVDREWRTMQRDHHRQLAIKLNKFFIEAIDRVDAVVISDYGKWVVNEFTIPNFKLITQKCFVDPYPKNIHYYPNHAILTPNKIEYDQIKPATFENMIVTEGVEGMTVMMPETVEGFDATCTNPVCVVGAGDVVLACVAASMISNESLLQAAAYANTMAGAAVARPYTSCILMEDK